MIQVNRARCLPHTLLGSTLAYIHKTRLQKLDAMVPLAEYWRPP